MRYLLDHAVVTAYLDGEEWAKTSLKENWEECYLPSIVLSALYQYIDSDRQETLERFVNLFPIINFDKSAAVEYGRIRRELGDAGKSASTLDILIAAVVRSQNDAILVTLTRRVGYFNEILRPEKIQDWKSQNIAIGIRCLTRNQPGVIHKISVGLAKLQVNIVSIKGESYGNERNRDGSNLKFTINLPPDMELQDIESSIRQSDIEIRQLQQSTEEHQFEESDIGYKICVFECNNTISAREFNNARAMQIFCQDRIGLLADITGCLFQERIDIVNINSHVSDDQDFEILLTLNSDNSPQNWEAVWQLIREVNGVKNIQYYV